MGHKGCTVYGNGHKVTNCTVFNNMSLGDTRALIRDKHMCFGCLASGHISKECRNRHICAVCSKRHPILLHDYSFQPQGDSAATAATADNVNLPTDFISEIKTNNRVTTMVLPVMLRHSSSNSEILV